MFMLKQIIQNSKYKINKIIKNSSKINVRKITQSKESIGPELFFA